MIRLYDQLGRLKIEIDPACESYTHVSYVMEQPPYRYSDHEYPFNPMTFSRYDSPQVKGQQRRRKREALHALTGDK